MGDSLAPAPSLQLIYYLTQTQVTKLLLLVHRDLTSPSGPMKPILLGVLFSNDTDITIVRLAPDHQCFQIFQARNLWKKYFDMLEICFGEPGLYNSGMLKEGQILSKHWGLDTVLIWIYSFLNVPWPYLRTMSLFGASMYSHHTYSVTLFDWQCGR